MEEGTAPPATSERSLRTAGVFREGLEQRGKVRLTVAALEPSQGLGLLILLEEKTSAKRLEY